MNISNCSQIRIALIHATRVAIEPIEVAAKALWPEAELVSILEEALSIDRAANTVPMAELDARIVDLARYAERLKPDGILYTCSAFGQGIQQAARYSDIPVHKPNEAMFEAALSHGNRVAMIYTFPPAVDGMHKEFREVAYKHGSGATLTPFFADGAIDALKAGDEQTHNRLVADVADGISDFDVVLLAHFSTAQAAPAVCKVTSTPVLSSPEAAISKMKKCVSAQLDN